jgi:tRNA/rRNA methyltransferase
MFSLDGIKIILVEPVGPLNVGSVARVMKNMGLSQLVLVSPQCDPLGEEARRMAVHGVELLEQAQQVPSLAIALQGCHRAIATTARSRSLETPLETPRQALPWLIQPSLTTALIFGREDRGLSNDELNQAHRFVGIPANPNYTSLNLAQSVAICAYELSQAQDQPDQQVTLPVDRLNLATSEQLEGYYQHLERNLLTIGVLYPHTAHARIEKLRRLYQRAQLTSEEVALLRGILGQVDWLWQQLPASHSLSQKPTP